MVPENIHSYPEEGHWKFQGSVCGGGGGGVSEANIFKGKYETKLEFPGGWGVQIKKKPCEGGVWLFSGTTQ